MTLDAANRSFWTLIATTAMPATYVLCGAFGSVIVAEPLDGGARSAATLGVMTAVTFGLAACIRSIKRQLAASRRLLHRVRDVTLPIPDALGEIAADVGFDGRVVFLDDPGRFSFVFGALTPRVAVSRGLFQGVSCAELRAVLEHERYHVENLDPLKLLLAQALSAAFFFLPSVDLLRTRYLAGRELAADRRAVNLCGRRPLASALLKVVGAPEWVELEDVAAIGWPALLDARVAQLETGVEPKPVPLVTTGGVLSLLGAALLAAALLASGSSFGVALSTADLIDGLICATPFGGAAIVMSAILARRARRPLRASQTL